MQAQEKIIGLVRRIAKRHIIIEQQLCRHVFVVSCTMTNAEFFFQDLKNIFRHADVSNSIEKVYSITSFYNPLRHPNRHLVYVRLPIGVILERTILNISLSRKVFKIYLFEQLRKSFRSVNLCSFHCPQPFPLFSYIIA